MQLKTNLCDLRRLCNCATLGPRVGFTLKLQNAENTALTAILGLLTMLKLLGFVYRDSKL